MLSSYSFSEEKPSKKINKSNFLKNIIEKEKEKYEPIDYKDIVDLGTPINITDLPEGMVKNLEVLVKNFTVDKKKLQQSCHNLLKEVNNIMKDIQTI